MTTTTEAELLLLIDGDEYGVSLLPAGPSRRRMIVARRGSRTRRYEVEELASGFVRCGCKGFGFRGACKHVAAARVTGLVGAETVPYLGMPVSRGRGPVLETQGRSRPGKET
jgi:hypothetical protein